MRACVRAGSGGGRGARGAKWKCASAATRTFDPSSNHAPPAASTPSRGRETAQRWKNPERRKGAPRYTFSTRAAAPPRGTRLVAVRQGTMGLAEMPATYDTNAGQEEEEADYLRWPRCAHPRSRRVRRFQHPTTERRRRDRVFS